MPKCWKDKNRLYSLWNQIKYFPYSQGNGILRYYYNQGSNSYNSHVIVQDFAKSDGAPRNAIDFDSSSFAKVVALTICFPYDYINIKTYEITTTRLGCRPNEFSASTSVDGVNFYNSQSYKHPMTLGETKEFSYISNYSKCFRYSALTFIPECNNFNYHDIVQIELYGYLKSNFEIIQIGCSHTPKSNTMCSILLLVMLYIEWFVIRVKLFVLLLF